MAPRDPLDRRATSAGGDSAPPDSFASPPTPSAYLPARDQTSYLSRDDGRLQAPISLPSPRELEVKLVSITTVLAWKESSGDLSLALVPTSLFAGAALGVVVNWATGPDAPFSKVSFFVLALFGVLAILSGIWCWRLKRRADAAWKRIEAQRATASSEANGT